MGYTCRHYTIDNYAVAGNHWNCANCQALTQDVDKFYAHCFPYWRESIISPSLLEPRQSVIGIRFMPGVFERRIRNIVWQWDTGLKLHIYGYPVDSLTAGHILGIGEDDVVSLPTQYVEEDPDKTDPDETDTDTTTNTGDTDPVTDPVEEPTTDETETEEEKFEPYYEMEIPDEYFTKAGNIVIYLMNRTETSMITVGIIILVVNERPKLVEVQDDPTTDPTCEEKCAEEHSALEARIAELEAKIEQLTTTEP